MQQAVSNIVNFFVAHGESPQAALKKIAHFCEKCS